MARKKSAAAGNGSGAELVELLLRSGESEVKDIDKALAVIDAEIDELNKKRSSLASMRKAIQLRLHGRTMASRVSPGQRENRRTTIHDWLGENGPAGPKEIAKATGIPISGVHKLLKHKWFVRTADGWNMATSGAVPAGN